MGRHAQFVGSWSLSARRAWIEIGRALRQLQSALVALRKESVDRNCDAGDCTATETASLSARRAWIEMIEEVSKYVVKDVALRKESVDRNGGTDGTRIYC